jgi:hypothetical protein
VLAACGGSGGSSSSGPSPTQVSATPDVVFARNGAEVLGRSGSAFSSSDVTSFSSETHFEESLGAMRDSVDTTFALQLPDMMYAKSIREGGDTEKQFGRDPAIVEMLVRDNKLYETDPLTGHWLFLPGSLTGIGPDYLAQTGSGFRSVFDYSGFMKKTPQKVQFIGMEEIDGVQTAHYSFDAGLNDMFASFLTNCVSNCDFEAQAGQQGIGSVVTADVWIGSSDYLPYKLALTASIDAPTGHGDAVINATYANYNEPVTIPDAPLGAVPYSGPLP